MHKNLVPAQESCACTENLCMHRNIVHAQDLPLFSTIFLQLPLCCRYVAAMLPYVAAMLPLCYRYVAVCYQFAVMLPLWLPDVAVHLLVGVALG